MDKRRRQRALSEERMVMGSLIDDQKARLNYQFHNLRMGYEGEHTVSKALEGLGFRVKDHLLTDPGADISAFKGDMRVIAEVLNWYGGYIHRSRFISIIRNLTEHKGIRIIVTFRVKLLDWQKKLLKAIGAIHIYLPKPDVGEIKRMLRGVLLSSLPSICSYSSGLMLFSSYLKLSARYSVLNHYKIKLRSRLRATSTHRKHKLRRVNHQPHSIRPSISRILELF